MALEFDFSLLQKRSHHIHLTRIMAAKLELCSEDNYYHFNSGHPSVEALIETADLWRGSVSVDSRAATPLLPPMLSLPPQAFERTPTACQNQNANISLDKESLIIPLPQEDPYIRVPSSPSLVPLHDYYAVYCFLQNAPTVSVAGNKIERVRICPETPVSARSALLPKRCSGHSKAPRLVQIQTYEPTVNRGLDNKSPLLKLVGKFPVVLKFRAKKSFLAVVSNSGPEEEYKLPIFQNLVPLSVMKKFRNYEPNKEFQKDEEVQVVKAGEMNQVSIKRYESRLTLVQLAWILGLQDYNISLTKDVETIVLAMFDQLCGFKIGDKTWSRGICKDERKRMIARVHKFAILYFPTFTEGIVEVIIKRGAYSRTQEFLRRKRRKQKRSVELV